MHRSKKRQSLPRNKETKQEYKLVEILSELTESGQEKEGTFQHSEPSLGAQRDPEPPGDLGVCPPDKQRTRSNAVTEHKQSRELFGETQPVAREHLVCSMCDQGVRHTDLYLLACCHSVCLECVRIEEGYYRCPNESCLALASVQHGELRANLLSRDYKRAQQQGRRGDRRQGAGSRQEPPLCERCYSAQCLTATHLCLDCDRLMCPVCLDIHTRGEGAQHLVSRAEELGGYRVEQLMGEMQARLGLCGNHTNRTLVHFCTECDAFLCDGCLVEDHRQHVTTPVESRLSELKERFLSHIKSSYSCTLGLRGRRDTLRELLERAVAQEEELVRRINDSYDELLKQVERKRTELIYEAWAHFSRSKRDLTLRIQHLDRELGQLVRTNTYLTSSAQLCSVRTLEENSSHLIQPCSLMPHTALLSRELPAPEQLRLKLAPHTERAIRDSGTLVTALNYSNIRPDLVMQGEGVLTRPYAVVVDSRDRLIVADGPRRSVLMFKEEKKVSEIWDEEHLGYPWGLALSEESLFVTDGLWHSVVKYSLDGTFQRQAGSLGDGKEQLDNPMGVSCGALVYVCDSGNNRLQVWGQDLEWRGVIGQGKLDHPRDAALTPDEMLVVLDEGNPCLHIYNLKGNLVGNYGTRGPGKGLVNPFFIAADGEGGIIVSDYGGDTVKVLSLSDGKTSYRMDSGAQTGVEVRGPNGVFVDTRGRVLLVCGQSNQLIRFYLEK